MRDYLINLYIILCSSRLKEEISVQDFNMAALIITVEMTPEERTEAIKRSQFL